MGEIEKVSNPAAIGRRTALVTAGTVGIGLAGAAVGKAAMAGDAGPGSGRSLAAETRSGTAACVLAPKRPQDPTTWTTNWPAATSPKAIREYRYCSASR